ncbi:DNA polymerase III subunit alpha [bacterium SCSIO 12741]|nr:DNA polymerase III subunit alpha [bacterium SCSIO 12741]
MYLNSHSYYSLRYGTIKTEELLQMAKLCGVRSMALTDINNTSASMDFMRLSSKYEVNPVLGVDFRNGAQQQFILLARNNDGFFQINRYLSNHLHEAQPTSRTHDANRTDVSETASEGSGNQSIDFPETAPALDDTFVIYPMHAVQKRSIQAEDLNDHEYVGVSREDLKRLRFTSWDKHRDKLVVLQTVSFRNKKDYNAHRILRAIDNNQLLSKLPAEEQGSPDHQMIPEEELRQCFAEHPELIANTERLLDSCQVNLDFDSDQPRNQRTYTNNEDLDFRLMKKLCEDGLNYRYVKTNAKIEKRIEKELEIIREKGFVSYFLINWKILKYARSKGYFYVGRGSGANSIVAYLLRITDVDPVELDLYFERFINLYRKNPPDFDIDFSWADRDDIIEFIFKTFPHTALITVYNTFQYRAAVREIGKVFGLPKQEMDALTRNKFLPQNLDQLSRLVLVYAKYINNFPNYLGIHAGGIVISEEPIHAYTATFMPPKGFPTTQFDMIVAEDIGLYKFDILSQRGLGKIKDAVEVVAGNYPERELIDIHDIKRFKTDERIRELLREAKAIGCFYVESPAMRMLMKKLQVDNYLGLVAASSVIRPGVARSGMMREYILRYRYPERRADANKVLTNIMPETYGVMVYQEDVIKVAHYYGGLTLGEADMLRRGMSGKFRSREEFQSVKQKFFDNCRDGGKQYEEVKEIWRQIESFAGYAFAKGHSASYAVESYQSLFLKAYYPLEYMVATINNFGGFYRTELYVHEARMHGATIHAPCVNRGRYESHIEGTDIYLGFILLKSLESRMGHLIVHERTKNGAYQSLDDFIDRIPIGLEQLAILIKINAFRFTGRNKRELLWEAHMKIRKVVLEEQVVDLFRVEKISFQTPPLSGSELEDAFDEMEYIGFPLCNPFRLLQEDLPSTLQARELAQHIGKTVTVTGYLITSKNTTTSKGEQMHFGNFLDVRGDFIDTVHFPAIAAQYPFHGRGVYAITGKVTEEFDCLSIDVTRLEKLAIIEDPRYAEQENGMKQTG